MPTKRKKKVELKRCVVDDTVLKYTGWDATRQRICPSCGRGYPFGSFADDEVDYNHVEPVPPRRSPQLVTQ